jgi:hypothetical protein
MVLDRKLLRRPFTTDSPSSWACPACKGGILVLDKESIQDGPTAKTTSDRSESDRIGDNWDYGNYEGRFCCLLKCNHAGCQQTVAVAGLSRYLDRQVGPQECEYELTLFPGFYSPAPELFRLPPNCPEQIVQQVRAAFSLYWCDLGSCLNHLRAAVELLLDEMEIERFLKKDGRETRISLHARIDILRSRHPKLSSMCDQLTAVKWLGNVGSHVDDGGEITHDTVFDAFDILEYVLRERFENTHRFVAKISEEIIKNKGPR